MWDDRQLDTPPKNVAESASLFLRVELSHERSKLLINSEMKITCHRQDINSQFGSICHDLATGHAQMATLNCPYINSSDRDMQGFTQDFELGGNRMVAG